MLKTKWAESPVDQRIERLKELLVEWAVWNIDRQGGYPKQSAFVTLRVDGGNRSTDTFYQEAPPEIIRLDGEIERLAPAFKRILAIEWFDRRPQKTKAAVLNMPRQVFSQRLKWIYEQLAFAMFGC